MPRASRAAYFAERRAAAKATVEKFMQAAACQVCDTNEALLLLHPLDGKSDGSWVKTITDRGYSGETVKTTLTEEVIVLCVLCRHKGKKVEVCCDACGSPKPGYRSIFDVEDEPEQTSSGETPTTSAAPEQPVEKPVEEMTEDELEDEAAKLRDLILSHDSDPNWCNWFRRADLKQLRGYLAHPLITPDIKRYIHVRIRLGE